MAQVLQFKNNKIVRHIFTNQDPQFLYDVPFFSKMVSAKAVVILVFQNAFFLQ